MEYALLGLLLRDDLTIYQMKKIFELSFSMVYGDSYGSLQSALKRAMAKGWIDREAFEGAGRRKMPYRITQAGRQRFFDWMMEEIPAGKLETTALTKLYFLGELAHTQRLQVLKHIQQLAAQLRQIMLGVHELNAPWHDSAEPWVRYRLSMLDYGLVQVEASLQFFDRLLTREQAQAE